MWRCSILPTNRLHSRTLPSSPDYSRTRTFVNSIAKYTLAANSRMAIPPMNSPNLPYHPGTALMLIPERPYHPRTILLQILAGFDRVIEEINALTAIPPTNANISGDHNQSLCLNLSLERCLRRSVGAKPATTKENRFEVTVKNTFPSLAAQLR